MNSHQIGQLQFNYIGRCYLSDDIILSPTFYTSISFLSLSACYFISSCILFNAAPASFCTFFILFTNSVAFSTFPFCLISIPILNSLLQSTINRDTLVVKYVLLLIANSTDANHSSQSFCL